MSGPPGQTLQRDILPSSCFITCLYSTFRCESLYQNVQLWCIGRTKLQAVQAWILLKIESNLIYLQHLNKLPSCRFINCTFMSISCYNGQDLLGILINFTQPLIFFFFFFDSYWSIFFPLTYSLTRSPNILCSKLSSDSNFGWKWQNTIH